MQTTEAVMERPSPANIIRSVRMIWTLYVKDLRELAGICLSLIVLSVIWQGVTTVTHIRLYGVPPNAISFMFVTILAYQLYVSRRKGSIIQQQSLPVTSGLTLLTAFAALLTFVWVYVLFTESIDTLTDVIKTYHLYHSVYQGSQVTISYDGVSDVAVSYWRLFLLMLTDRVGYCITIEDCTYYGGMVCIATGIMHPTAGKFRLRYWAGFLAVLMLVIAVFGLLNRFELQWYSLFGRHTYVVLGVGFASIGAILYNRYAEV